MFFQFYSGLYLVVHCVSLTSILPLTLEWLWFPWVNKDYTHNQPYNIPSLHEGMLLGLLFALKTVPLSQSYIRSLLCSCVWAAGFNNSAFTPHCFRIGSAITATMQGIQSNTIQRMGGWHLLLPRSRYWQRSVHFLSFPCFLSFFQVCWWQPPIWLLAHSFCSYTSGGQYNTNRSPCPLPSIPTDYSSSCGSSSPAAHAESP